MSNDEVLSSDADHSLQGDAEIPSPAQDASDAPPANAPRAARRTSRTARPRAAAGSDAASTASPEPASSPARPPRAPRTRRKPVSFEESAVEDAPVPAAPSDVPPPVAATDSEPVGTPETASQPRRRRSGRKPAVPLDSESESANTETGQQLTPLVPRTDAPSPEGTPETGTDTGDAAPAGRRRRSRRSPAPQEAPMEAAPHSEDSVPSEPPAVPASEPVSEATPTRPSRRRSSRNRRDERTTAQNVTETKPVESENISEPIAETPLTPRSHVRIYHYPHDDSASFSETPTASLDNEEEEDANPEEGAVSTETTPNRRRRERRGRQKRGKNEDRLRPARETVTAGESGTSQGIIEEPIQEVVATAEPELVIDTSVGAHLLPVNGVPQIHIDGTLYPPILFFGNQEDSKNQQRVLEEVRRAARAGVHLHSTLVELPCPLSEASHALDEIDDRLRALLDADPDGYVMPRIVFLPAKGWKREYPTDMASYADGASGDPSLTSDRFWREAEHSLETMIAHLRGQAWGRRVFGYHLERGEWFQPMDGGFDRSIANRDAFRDWLREKYQNSLVALRAAWYDSDAQFHTAEIPALPGKPNPQRAFFETRRERRTIDFYEFTSESTARRLVALSKTVKKAADNAALVSVCYGYTLEFGHGYSGHLALSTLLAASTVNIVSGPPSYRDRKPGGAASLPAPYTSLALRGKLWLSEDDTKTYLAPTQQDPDDFNPRLPTRDATEAAQARTIGRALAQGTGVGWMDLWGEGWLDEDATWERIETFAQRYRQLLQTSRPTETPDVIALIDEKSLLHVARGEAFFRKLTNGLRDTLQRAGISLGILLQSDVLAEAFPLDAKLYLFLTPFRLPAEQRAAIKEKLQRGGKTLAWLYAPGACEERPSLGGMEEGAASVVGLGLRQQAWNSELGSRIVDGQNPITERMGGRDFGTRERLNPSFYVADEDAQVLAEYTSSGLPSLAVRNHGSWKSIFVGDPTLPLELLRGICRAAGVHVWVGGGEDVAYIGNGWVTIHASRDGQRTLRLPAPMAVYDATERRLVAESAREHRFFLRSGQTRLFAVGRISEFREMGLPNLTLPEGGRGRFAPRPEPEMPPQAEVESELPLETTPAPLTPTPSPAVSGLAGRPGHSLSEDLATLQAIVNMELSDDDLLDLEDEDEDDLLNTGSSRLAAEAALADLADPSGSARRRRRRGGRGRGRKRFDGEPEPTAPVNTTAQISTESGSSGNVKDVPSGGTDVEATGSLTAAPTSSVRIYHYPHDDSDAVTAQVESVAERPDFAITEEAPAPQEDTSVEGGKTIEETPDIATETPAMDTTDEPEGTNEPAPNTPEEEGNENHDGSSETMPEPDDETPVMTAAEAADSGTTEDTSTTTE